MRLVCRFYLMACKRWGPDGLTFSAYAWKTDSRLVPVIDRIFLTLRNEPFHCRAQYFRETKQ